MPCWEPKVCCCCASLKTGTLVLGIITLCVFGIELLSVMVAAAFKYDEIKLICYKLPSKSVPDDENTDVEHTCTIIMISVFVTWGVISLAIILFSSLLLVGIKKSMPRLMIPYMVGQVIGILLLGTVYITVFVMSIISGAIFGVTIILELVIFTVIMGLQVYLLMIVRAHYKELRQRIQDRTRNPDSAEVMLHKI